MAEKAKSDWERIIWPKKADCFGDITLREKNVVKLLCDLGKVITWADVGMTGFVMMPYKYDIKGIKVEYLPNWGFYEVAGISLNLPRDKNDVENAVQAVRDLIALGLRARQ